jgi:hypothetical protein
MTNYEQREPATITPPEPTKVGLYGATFGTREGKLLNFTLSIPIPLSPTQQQAGW